METSFANCCSDIVKIFVTQVGFCKFPPTLGKRVMMVIEVDRVVGLVSSSGCLGLSYQFG